jgi:hypothetical protein
MSFDNSRFTFNPWNDYLGVVMEQGRVQMDSDWNEWLAEFARRIQAGTLDTFGRAVYPSTTPNAFKITASGGALSIGAGRMYVDGILAENHGPPASSVWDPALDEMSGAPQIDGVAEVTYDYTKQPYLPGATLPTGSGPFLAYLDVWRRPITWLEDPDLIDEAVAVDTSGRIQTVWQVKLLDVSGVSGGVTCSTPDTSIPAWETLIQPSAGQLSTGVATSTPSGPCCLNSSSGFTGMENQFYRVQIHKGGAQGGSATATFKWSRDNASVETGVTAISTVTNTAGNTASQLAVMSLGRDQTLGFAKGNWIEITDDDQELNGQTGELHLIDSVDFAQKTVTLDSTVSATSFPLTAGQTDPLRHTRITRWDQAGKIYENDNVTVWWDLGAAGSTGDIPVPPAGTTLILENGVAVTFGLNPTTGSFYTSDFWTFAARTADGSVETLNQAYPRGIHHHYARLSVVTFPSTASDCRVEWPPAGGGSDCCCTTTIQASDITGTITLQSVIDRYQGLQSPTEICLGAGIYSLAAPLRFTAAHSNIGLKACQDGSVTIQVQQGQESQFGDGMIVFDNASNVSLRGIYFAVPIVNFTAAGSKFAGLAVSSLPPDLQTMLGNLVVSIGVRPVNCTGLAIENCEFGFADFEEDLPNANAQPFGAGILASGASSSWQITGTTFAGVGNFLVGIVIAPEVTFTPARRIIPKPRPGAGLTGRAGLTDQVELKNQVDINTGLELKNQVDQEIGSGVVLGNLGNIGKGAAPAYNFAAQGGTVLPSSLDEAVFKDNDFSGLTVAALVVGASGTVEFTENEVDQCNAGFWLLSPLQAGLVASDPNSVATAGLIVAMGYPLPANDATPATQWVNVPAAPASVRIYAGTATFTDSLGNEWLPDANAAGVTVNSGALSHPAPPPQITDALPGATDQALYQSERYGPDFSYTFSKLSPGFYQMILKFAEIFYLNAQTNKGVRVFDVAINGQTVLTDFDIVADVGSADFADDWTFNNIVPDAQGDIVVEFTGTAVGSDGNAKIDAVELDAQWNGEWSNATSQNLPAASATNELNIFYVQLAQLAQQGFVNAASSPMILRIGSNEMAGLSSPGVLILGDDQVLLPKTSSVMIIGNRVSASISGLINRSLFADTEVELVAAFMCTGAIAAVTRCVISSNMFMNESTGKGDALRLSFFLDDGSGAPLTPTVPPPELMVSANLFQGRISILPARYPSSSSVPAPMNSWNFLNTVTL